MLTRRTSTVALAVGLGLMLVIPALAVEPIDVDASKVAIKGYDTVAYFTDGKPTKGDAQYQYDWQGAHWYFSSAEHRQLFSQKPESYAPRFGGFCALGMSIGKRFPVDPEAWTIVDNKLYLNSDQSALAQFKADTTKTIAAADAQWENVKAQQ